MKTSSLAKQVVPIFILLSLMPALQSCLATRDRNIKKWERREWKVVKTESKDQPKWKISKREMVGSSILQYKIEGRIESTPSKCLSAFREDLFQQTHESMRKKFPIYKIKEVPENVLLTYVIHNEPFPFKDTEMSVRYQFKHEEDGRSEVKWKEAWNDSVVSPSKNLNRVETFRGSWDFIASSRDDKSTAVNVVEFDPKRMPRWLFEPMVFKFLKQGLQKLEQITME